MSDQQNDQPVNPTYVTQPDPLEELRRNMAAKPETPPVGSIWVHRVRNTQYITTGFSFDSSHGQDDWKINFRRIEDRNCEFPFVRNLEEFLQNFTRVG